MTTINSWGSDTPAEVAKGGTGVATMTGVVTGNGTGAVTAAAVTQYGVLVGGASNAVASTAVGTAAQVLTSNGAGVAPTFQAAGGGGGGAWDWVSTTSVSSVSEVAFEGLTGDVYKVIIEAMIPATDATTLQLQVSDDGGSTYAAVDYQFVGGVQVGNTGDNAIGNVTAAYIGITSSVSSDEKIGTATGEYGLCADVEVYNLNKAGSPAYVISHAVHMSSAGGLIVRSSISGLSADDANGGSTRDVDSFRFYMSSGNIASAIFSLYKQITS